MKYLLITLLISMTLHSAVAQDILGGVRLGIGRTMDIKECTSGFIDKTLDKELFMRYETKGRLAFEVGAIHYNTSSTHALLRYYEVEHFTPGAPPLTHGLENQYYYSNTDFSLYANIKSTYTEERLSDGAISTRVNTYNKFGNFQLGLSHTLIYDISSIFITSTVSYLIQPGNLDRL